MYHVLYFTTMFTDDAYYTGNFVWISNQKSNMAAVKVTHRAGKWPSLKLNILIFIELPIDEIQIRF